MSTEEPEKNRPARKQGGLLDTILGLIKVETMSIPGRVNCLGMVLSVFMVGSLSLTPFLEAVVRVIRPEVTLDVPVLQLFIAFAVFTVTCTLMLGYLEGMIPRRGKDSAE